MLILVHGAFGGLDELVIAIVAIGVLWLAVKLAGRKPAGDEDDEEDVEAAPNPDDQPAPAHPPATHLRP
jgi:hypothetical protein